MSEEVTGYGYTADEPAAGNAVNIKFGLNAGTARLAKFEWTNAGGKDGAEQEALDIQFMTEGSTKAIGYRLFPITKAFTKEGAEVIDPKAPEFQKALKDFNASVVHILHCFVDSDTIKTALSGSIANFKDFCKITASLLPKNYSEIPLDIFAQWQWQLKPDAKQTYLELPKNMTHGKWVCASVPALNQDGSAGTWTEKVHPAPETTLPIALKYVDGLGNIHPFTRSGWYMLNAFAHKQVGEGATDATETSATETASESAAENKSQW